MPYFVRVTQDNHSKSFVIFGADDRQGKGSRAIGFDDKFIEAMLNLDNNPKTNIVTEVLEAMMPYLTCNFG